MTDIVDRERHVYGDYLKTKNDNDDNRTTEISN